MDVGQIGRLKSINIRIEENIKDDLDPENKILNLNDNVNALDTFKAQAKRGNFVSKLQNYNAAEAVSVSDVSEANAAP